MIQVRNKNSDKPCLIAEQITGQLIRRIFQLAYSHLYFFSRILGHIAVSI